MKFEKNLVGVNRIRKEDKINQLPNCLLSEILMYLPTKDVVKTSVLCRRWRYLWQSVPVLDMEINCLIDFDKLAFLDKFIKLKGDLLLQRAKLRYLGYGCKSLNKTSLNTVISQKIQHLDVEIDRGHDEVKIPPSIYTSCERLVSLKLCRASLPKLPMSVSLPCLKIMDLHEIEVVEDLDIEMLISVCPALETLTITTDKIYRVKVSSQSLLSFSLIGCDLSTIRELVFETPKLKSLKMNSLIFESFSINDIMNSIVKLDLTVLMPFRVNFPKFIPLMSCVRDVTISFYLLQGIQYEVLKSKSRLKFHTVSTLRVINIMIRCWKDCSVFLESCPNIKSLFLEFSQSCIDIDVLYVPKCVSSSLELVEIDGSYLMEPYMKEVGRYFMENSALLKKFTLRVEVVKAADRMKLKEFFTSSRRSKACEVIVRFGCPRVRRFI